MNNSLFNAYTLTGTFDVYANSAETIDLVAQNITTETITTNTAQINDYIEFADTTKQYTAATSFDPTANYTFSGNDVFTGTVNYTQIPTCSGLCTLPNQIPNKSYVDSVIPTSLLGTNNSWTGTNAFNSHLPTSNLTPTISGELVPKFYVDGLTINILSNANAWTGTNTYNTNLPTSTQTPSSNTELTTKVYVDNKVIAVYSSANAWTSTNTFNSNLPTSTLTPSTSTQLTTKGYVDSAITNTLAGNITISGVLTVANTTQSTGPTTGALVVSGGLGVGKDMYITGNILSATQPLMYVPLGATVSFYWTGSSISYLGSPYNCSVSRTSAGIYVISFTTALMFGNPLCFLSAYDSGTNNLLAFPVAKSTGSITINLRNGAGTLKDPDTYCDCVIYNN